MKKLLISLLAVLFAAPSFAQYNSGEVSISESTLYYGIRLGVDFANISGDGTGGFKSRTGMTLGFALGLHVSEQTPICLESGIYYTVDDYYKPFIKQDFNFSPKQELKLTLKDLLEENVDKKYILNDKQIERILTTNYISGGGTTHSRRNMRDIMCKRLQRP